MCAHIKGEQVKNRQVRTVTVRTPIYHCGIRLYNSTQLKKLNVLMQYPG